VAGQDSAESDPYQIEELLGEGAVGAVYRALDRGRGEHVALKLLRELDPGALYRFKQEFRVLAGIAHRNLVRLHELVSAGDRWFFTMELVDGVDFLTHVRGPVEDAGEAEAPAADPGPAVHEATEILRRTPLPAPDVSRTVDLPLPRRARRRRRARPARAIDEAQTARLRDALLQLATGVVVLHDARRLHRDLKPSNVMVTRAGRVVILDFGVSSELHPEERAVSGIDLEIVGTPAYMAPELVDGAPVREAADWYAVGVMLYESLVGRPPFRGPLDRVMEAKRSIDAQPPSEVAPGVPADLEALCLALLARDPAARPSGHQVIERLGGRSAGMPLRHTRVAAALVGRGRQIAALTQALERTREGAPVIAFVHGGSGMGKSALCTAFLAEQRDKRTAIGLVGRCYERESVPYKALDGLVDSIYRHLADLPRAEIGRLLPAGVHSLARLFPVLRRLEGILGLPWTQLPTSDPHELRRRAVAALRELLHRMQERTPLVLHIDDVQWGDSDSAGLLSDVLRAPGAPALLLLASYRSEDASTSAFLRALEPVPDRTVEIPVRRLALEDARALAQTLLGDGPGHGLAEDIARESGGNPFFVNELVGFTATHHGARARLGEVLDSRLAALPPGARRLLDVVALAAGPLRQQVALAAAELGEGGRAALDLLRDAHLVLTRDRDGEDVIESYHDRIREEVARAMPPPQRRGAHARLAQALLAGDEAAELVAFHFERAEDAERAAEHYLRAGAHAADILAFARAASHYRRALALRPLAGRAESDVLARLADAESNAGNPVVAVELYRRAAVDASRADALRLYGRAVEDLLRAARVDDGIAALRELLPELGGRLPTRVLPALVLARVRIRLRGQRVQLRDEAEPEDRERSTRTELYWTAAAALGLSDHLLGALFQSWHYLDAVDAGDRRHAARALALEAIFTALRGVRHRARAERILQRAGELAAPTGDALTQGIVYAGAAISAYQYGEWLETYDQATRGARIARESVVGAWWHLNCLDMYELWSSCYLGRVRDMSRRAAELLRAAEHRGDLFAATMISSGPTNLAWLARGDLEGARAVSRAALARWPQERYLLQHYWDLQAQTSIDLYAGDGEQAWRRIEVEAPRARRAHMLGIALNHVETVHMRGRSGVAAVANAAAVAAAHRSGGQATRERILRRVDHEAAAALAGGTTLALVTAPLVRAAVSHLRGDDAAAARWLEQAVARADVAGMMLHAAVARRRLGRIVGGDAGVALVAEADAWMVEQGIADRDRLTEVFAPGFGD
jgi:serine/threonine protein kinase